MRGELLAFRWREEAAVAAGVVGAETDGATDGAIDEAVPAPDAGNAYSNDYKANNEISLNQNLP